MSELAERIRKVADDLLEGLVFTQPNEREATLAEIEQALLAERRLAMEECAEIVAPREMHTHLFPHQYKYCNVCPIAAKLRAAAEKEAGTR